MTHEIDCHVLTLPRSRPDWAAELRADLDREPVNQHWMPGVDGDLGGARAAGFAAGDAPYVTSQDPDDRVLPGVYAALRRALEDNPAAPFAWAGEKLVLDDLTDVSTPPHVWPYGYSPRAHVRHGTHVHGVKLYRRELVAPLLDGIRAAGLACEFYLDLALAKPWNADAPRPVHVPIVGRLWRQHEHNGSRQFKRAHFDHVARMLGFASMEALRATTIEATR